MSSKNKAKSKGVGVKNTSKAAEVKTPEVKAPEVKAPEVKAPEVKAPEVKAPEVKAPEVKAPEVKAPEVKAPKVKAPKVKAPEVESPEAKIEGDKMSKECKEKVKEFFEAHEEENAVYVTADGNCFHERDKSYAVDHKNKLELEMFHCKRTK
jgi:hypothetical protein